MPTFSLTTCNARWAIDLGGNPFDLAAAVARFDTDIVAIQEVWEPAGGNHLQRLAETLGYRTIEVPLAPSLVQPSPQITADPDQATGTWGIALLSRRPIVRTRIVDLGRLVERWDVADRLAIIADLDIDGVTVSVAVVHLSFVLPNAAAQLRRLEGFLPVGRPSVVAGDCNLWGPVVAATLARHRRTVRGRTWPEPRPHSQLDHIAISPEVTFVRGAVLGSIGSDHLPVTATLEVSAAPR